MRYRLFFLLPLILITFTFGMILTAPEKAEAARMLKVGSEGRDVLMLEKRLQRLRYFRHVPDRKFDYETQAAVWALQGDLGLVRDGIFGPKTRALTRKAKPPRPYRNIGRRGLIVSLSRGNIQVIENRRVKWVIHTASGKASTPTVRGTFAIQRRVRHDISYSYNNSPMPYAQYFYRGYALHESSSVPAYPASHGCLRLRHLDARYLWSWAKTGTRVVVF